MIRSTFMAQDFFELLMGSVGATRAVHSQSFLDTDGVKGAVALDGHG